MIHELRILRVKVEVFSEGGVVQKLHVISNPHESPQIGLLELRGLAWLPHRAIARAGSQELCGCAALACLQGRYEMAIAAAFAPADCRRLWGLRDQGYCHRMQHSAI